MNVHHDTRRWHSHNHGCEPGACHRGVRLVCSQRLAPNALSEMLPRAVRGENKRRSAALNDLAVTRSLQHAVAKRAGIRPERWQYARIETGSGGGFSSEQMHHWVSAGFLKPEQLLIRRVSGGPEGDESDESFYPISKYFASVDSAFVPAGMDPDAWALFAQRLAQQQSDDSTPSTSRKAARTTPAKGSGDSDAFPRKDIAALAPAMKEYFLQGDAWYYMDSEGVQHGPFGGSKVSWRHQKRLWVH
jgi:hypothetical protein